MKGDMERIADALEELLRIYKAHVRLTARSARMALEPALQHMQPGQATDILSILAELEESVSE